MKHLVLVFLGGGLGSSLRYLISKALNPHHQHFYFGTFLSNILGCFLIGLIMGLFSKGKFVNEQQLALLVAGFCGGFTTFSAFALEKFSLLKAGENVYFGLYLIMSIVFGLLAVSVGTWFAKLI